jgi:hypothetical protein
MAGVKFEKQTYGATVATILETDDSVVEVQERNDGCYGLIVHCRRPDRDEWDDLTAYLKAEHFDALGLIARRMRGVDECCRGLAPITECQCERLRADRAEQDLALRDAIRETAATADELAFWRYQAIYGRASMLDRNILKHILPEDSPVWKEAARQLDAARIQENRERTAHAEAPRDPAAT